MRQSVPYAVSYWYSGKSGYPTPFADLHIEPGKTSPVPYTITKYDLLGRVIEIIPTDSITNTTTTTYALKKDGLNQPYQETCVTDANDHTTCTRTDSRGRSAEVDPPEGPEVTYTYDAADRLSTATMGGAVTQIWYDYLGRKTKMDDADMGLWSYQYNALSSLIKQTDARGCITNLNYDLASRLSEKLYTITGCGAATTNNVTYSYDGIQHWQPFDSWPASGWVKAGNVTVTGGKLKLTGNGSWGSTYAYRTATLRDGQAVKFSFQVDATTNEAFISVDRGTWGNTDYRSWTLRIEGGYLKREYKEGTSNPEKMNLMAVKANTWYEGVLVIDGTAPGSSSESYTPRFRMVVWEKSNPAVYAQDRVSFSTGWSYADWKFVAQIKTSGKVLYIDYELEYDDGAIGQRSKMTDGSGYTQRTFTTRGQMQSESKKIEASTYLTQFGYFPDGSLRWMQYPDNEKLTYTNLPQKAPYSLQTSLDNGLYYVTSTSYGDVYYSSNERFVLRKLGGSNALQVKSLFFAWGTENGQGRLKQLTAGTTANPTLLLNLKYFTGTETPAYDAVGNITSILDANNSNQKQCYGYDSLNRLISAAVGIDDTACSGSVGNGEYADETYTYDSTTGNLSSKTGLGSYTYGDSNHAHAITATNSGNSYSYDANGNQTTRVINGVGTFTLTYDAENRLVSVSGTLSASFLYDGDGNRVKSTVGTTTVYIGTYYEVTGGSVTKYYYQGSSRVAMRNSNGVRYLFGDHLGSTSVTADGTGGNVIRQLYKAWGEVRYSSSSLPTKYTYTGQYSYNGSGEIGLMYYVARFYDPISGRFIQADTIISGWMPINFDRYAYVMNSPIVYNDPSGHDPRCILVLDDQCVRWSDGRTEETRFIPLDEWGEKMKAFYNAIKDRYGLESPMDLLKEMLATELGGLYDYWSSLNSIEGEHLLKLLASTAMRWMAWVSHCTAFCFDLPENIILNFIGRMQTIRNRYYSWKQGKPFTFTTVHRYRVLANLILQKILSNTDPTMYTGGYGCNGNACTWGNPRFKDENGKWQNYWKDQDKIDEFLKMTNGFNQISEYSYMSVTFKLDEFGIFTTDEIKYWKSPP
jgi:RHS repeat-associated protein